MSKSKAIGVRLKDRQIEQLDRLAQREGRDKDEMATALLERVLRLSEYPHMCSGILELVQRHSSRGHD